MSQIELYLPGRMCVTVTARSVRVQRSGGH